MATAMRPCEDIVRSARRNTRIDRIQLLLCCPNSLSDLENEGHLASIIREKKISRGQIFIHKCLQTPKSDRLVGWENTQVAASVICCTASGETTRSMSSKVFTWPFTFAMPSK